MEKKNTIEVTPNTLSNILDTLFEIKTLTPFIWGGPGIGKSSIVKNLALKKKYKFVDIRLSMTDPTSLLGILVPNMEKGTASWLPPQEFTNDEPTLFFFDEINSAPPSCQAAAYQIILDRKIGPHSIKDEDFIIAAGNNVSDRGVTYRMPNPLLNRFIHLDLRASFDDFNSYAIKNKFHPHVVGYLNYQKGDLYSPIFTTEAKGFPTPRSWEFVSKILYKADEKKLSNEILIPMISGAIGEGTTYKFMGYRRIAESIGNNIVDDILSGKTKVSKPQNIDATYALMMALCYGLSYQYDKFKSGKLKKAAYDNSCNNFMGYLMNPSNEIQPEMVIMAVRTCLSILDLDIDVDLPNWDKFFSNENYSKPIREAFTGFDEKK